MIGQTSQKPLLTSLQTGDVFLVERNSGNYSVLFSTISGQGGGGGGGGSSSTITGYSVQFAIGSYNFLSGQNDSTFINFGGVFPTAPIIVGGLSNNSGEPLLSFQFSGISTSGFFTNLSDTVTGANYNLNYIATTGSGFLNIGGAVGPSGVAGPQISNAITGLGVNNYITKWISNSGLTTGLIYESSSGIGVGIVNNEYYFHVTGQGKFNNICFDTGTTPNINNTVTVDFDNSAYQTYTLTGATTIKGTGYGAGKNLTARLVNDTGNNNLTWSHGWTWMGENPPLNILSGRWAILSLISFDSNQSGVAASCITSA